MTSHSLPYRLTVQRHKKIKTDNEPHQAKIKAQRQYELIRDNFRKLMRKQSLSKSALQTYDPNSFSEKSLQLCGQPMVPRGIIRKHNTSKSVLQFWAFNDLSPTTKSDGNQCVRNSRRHWSREEDFSDGKGGTTVTAVSGKNWHYGDDAEKSKDVLCCWE